MGEPGKPPEVPHLTHPFTMMYEESPFCLVINNKRTRGSSVWYNKQAMVESKGQPSLMRRATLNLYMDDSSPRMGLLRPISYCFRNTLNSNQCSVENKT